MDSDSSLAILILVVSLLVFAGVRLAQVAFLHLRQSNGSPFPESEVASRSVRRLASRSGSIRVLLSVLGMASVLAVGLSLAGWTLGGADASWGLGAVLAAGALLLLTLIHGSARTLGPRHHLGILWVAAPVLAGIDWALGPLFWAAERLGVEVQQWGANGSSNSTHVQPQVGEEMMPTIPTEDELLEADAGERRMIHAILRLEDVSAREIMAPRVDIVAVEVGTPLAGVAALIAEQGHSQLPVYKETIDNVVGIVHARDVLQSITSENGPSCLTDIARPALFVPDSKPLDQLLVEFQARRATIAVVVDEYGGTEGVITMEDLLEEIVGEIEDEFETGEPPIVRVSDREAIVDGRVTLDELNELFQTTLVGDGFDTLGGLLSAQLGKIPAIGDGVSLENLSMWVLSTSGRRVRKVRVVQQT